MSPDDHRSQRGPGSSIVRTRKDVRGVGSSLREGGGAVAVLVELLSVHPNLPSASPLASTVSRNT